MTPTRRMDGWAIQCRPRNRGAFPFFVTSSSPFVFKTRATARKAARSYRSLGLSAQAVRVSVAIAPKEIRETTTRQKLEAKIAALVELLARAWLAHEKPEWAEGECWNEVSLDVVWAVEYETGPGSLYRRRTWMSPDSGGEG